MRKLSILLFCLTILISCKTEKSDISVSTYLDLKPLNKNEIYNFRVLRVYDKRLPDLTDAQYENLYAAFTQHVKTYIGYNIKFTPLKKVDILDFFNSYNSDFENPKNKRILSDYINVNSDEGKQILKKTIEKVVSDLGEKVKQYAPFGIPNDTQKIKNYLFDNFLKKLNQIKNIEVKDGKFYNDLYAKTQSYVHWTVIANNIKNIDIIVTNTMIAGADKGMPIYVIKRGGISSAFVDNNPNNPPFYSVCVMGLFQYISKANFFMKERGIIPDNELLNVIAMLFGHEMGHLLMRADEMYEPKAGIHQAPINLDYYAWYKKVKSMKDKHPMDWIPRLKQF